MQWQPSGNLTGKNQKPAAGTTDPGGRLCGIFATQRGKTTQTGSIETVGNQLCQSVRQPRGPHL